MSNFELVKSAKFGEVACDFYGKDNEVFMTINQLAECLGYASKSGVEKVVSRNQYLKQDKFSTVVEIGGTDGMSVPQKTRVFNEDGIYEIAFKANTKKAFEFRSWVRDILKSLRSGKAKIVGMSDYQRLMMQTRAENAKVRKAQILARLAEQYDGTYKQVLHSYATKELTGEHLLPLPSLGRKTYTATEIGEQIGISANMVGILANRHNLKTEQYGAWFNDKARGHNKEVQTFRYFDNVLPVLQQLANNQAG